MSATAIYAAGMEVSEGGAIYAVLESRHATVRGMDDYLTQGVMGSDRCGNSDVGKCNAARHRSQPGQNLAVDRRSGHGARHRCPAAELTPFINSSQIALLEDTIAQQGYAAIIKRNSSSAVSAGGWPATRE